VSLLKEALLDPGKTLVLYGTTPPRAGATAEIVRNAAEKLAARVRPLPLDGIVVYDIQDESGRTASPRPFAFTGTVDPRDYSRLLRELTGKSAITYKCVGANDEAAWNAWLGAAARVGVQFLSIVGRPTSGVRYPLSLSRAIRLAAAHPAGFTVGGVVIAERHTAERSEAARMLAKGIEGCGYFISQTVYHAGASERLLADYARDCRGAGIEPRRVVLTFSPVGRDKTMTFLKWLGVKLPRETQRAILGAPDPLARSIDICRENLRRILAHDYAHSIPLGVNVESVSINKDEIDASVDLFHALAEVLAERR
jgi:5,10-methylenetetrahydrofolate reductase